jgi:two-component system, LytTR family, response regulator
MYIENSTISIPTRSSIERISVSEIIHFSNYENGTRIYLTGGRTIESFENLSFFEKSLATFNFFKVTKSTMINLYHVRNFQKRSDKVRLSDSTEIEITTKRKTEIKRMLFSSPLISLTKRSTEQPLLKMMA